MLDFLVGLALGALAAYAAMRVRYAEQERELSAGMCEVAALTRRLNDEREEFERFRGQQARLN